MAESRSPEEEYEVAPRAGGFRDPREHVDPERNEAPTLAERTQLALEEVQIFRIDSHAILILTMDVVLATLLAVAVGSEGLEMHAAEEVIAIIAGVLLWLTALLAILCLAMSCVRDVRRGWLERIFGAAMGLRSGSSQANGLTKLLPDPVGNGGSVAADAAAWSSVVERTSDLADRKAKAVLRSLATLLGSLVPLLVLLVLGTLEGPTPVVH